MSHTSSGASAGPASRSAPTILVVEAEVLVRMPLADYLRQCGYRVIEAATGAEARKVMQAGTPLDLVFASAGGTNNGFALASWVRRQYPGVKVLLSAGIPDAAAKAGDLCAELMTRPHEHATILRRIQALLHRANRPPARSSAHGGMLA